MSYKCEICNYETNDSGNFTRHKKTQKHIKLSLQKSITNNENDSKKYHELSQVIPKLSEVIPNEITKNDSKFFCPDCKLIFSHKSNLSRHKKKCKIKNDFNELSKLKTKLEIAEMSTKLEKEKTEIYNEFLKEKTELLNNFMNNANVLLNKATDNTKITAQAIQSVSVSALKYANDKFKDTPALLPLDNFNINNLSFDNDKKQLTEILIYNAKQKSLDKLLGNHIIKCYKKDNPEEQSFHTTDCSRLNYIVRDLMENALIWSVDKNGIKICSSIIKPLIEKCINALLDHQKELLDEMTLGNYNSKETVQTIINVLMTIDKGSLESDINKYIAPFFNLNKTN